ncbi:MAG: STAS/SEC14 domain-containing protein [Candidatus Woesearchaeota archaeon]
MRSGEFKTPITQGWLGEDQVARVFFSPNAQVTLQDAKDHFAACLKASRGERHPVLVDIRNLKSVEHPARKFFADESFSKFTKASALLVGSPLSKVLGSFFIGLNRPPYPIRIFSSEDEALEWLKKFQ